MIFAIDELPGTSGHPTDPTQWYMYYNMQDDKIYQQVLAPTDPAYPSWVEMIIGSAIREDMRIIDTLVKTKYSAKDYQTYLDEGLARIKDKWGNAFTSFLSSDPGIMCLEIVAGALEEASWYIDREADEFYMSLNRVMNNIVRLAAFLGYKPKPATSGSTDLTITLPNGPYVFDVPFYKGHQVQGPNGLIFELDSNQIIPAGDTEKSVTIYQGQRFTEIFTSSGEKNQTFDLSLIPDGMHMAEGYSICKVDGVEWDEYEFLPYGNIEAVQYDHLADPPKAKFGTGIVGKIPEQGKEIRITYVATDGKKGLLATENTIEKNLTSVVVNFQEISIEVTNPKAVRGGDDPESMDSIKTNAPLYFQAADRAVTGPDIETLAGKFSSSLYGSIAKANAISIRGIEDDLELQALLTELAGNGTILSGYLDTIKEKQDLINSKYGYTASIKVLNTSNKTYTAAVKSGTVNLKAYKEVVDGNIVDAESDINTAKSRLEMMPFQEFVGQGDGSTKVFSKVLSKVPVKEGSVTILLPSQTATKDGSDGDCDTTPGVVNSAAITFEASDVGKMIRIGGEYRQVLKYINANDVQYTGPRIYGTSLIVEVYPPSVIGYDQGGGSISGSGITGTVNYTSGSVSITFTVAPGGLSGQYGVPIMCTYQYEEGGIQAILDEALTDCDTAQTNLGQIDTLSDDIDGQVDSIDDNADSSDGICDDIDTAADETIDQADLALVVPVQMQSDIDAIEEYLDDVLSGDCKANIVRISCLVKDSNGFYTAPSNSLMQALKAHMDERRIETVRYSVVSGDYYLVEVDLLVYINVDEEAYVFSEVKTEVETDLSNMFKDRDYKQALYRKEYYNVVEGISGINYFNIRIANEAGTTPIRYQNSANTDDPPTADVDGNVFVGDYETITKGTIKVLKIADEGME